jgi:hypothetical protein
VLVVDHLKQGDTMRVSYWWRTIPQAAMAQVNPQGLGGFLKVPFRERLMVWAAVPLAFTMVAAVMLWLALSDPLIEANARTISSVVGGLFVGIILGAPIAWVSIKVFLPSRLLYVVGRVEGEPIWAIPPSIIATNDNDAEELVEESMVNMWTRETFKLGEEGWATKNFLEAIGAAKNREELRWGSRNGAPVGMDRRPPGVQE